MVTKKALPIAEMRQAYELFLRELKDACGYLESLLGAVAAAAPEIRSGLFVERAPELERRMHLLKGGAGFLQLEELAMACSAMERRCRTFGDRSATPAVSPSGGLRPEESGQTDPQTELKDLLQCIAGERDRLQRALSSEPGELA